MLTWMRLKNCSHDTSPQFLNNSCSHYIGKFKILWALSASVCVIWQKRIVLYPICLSVFVIKNMIGCDWMVWMYLYDVYVCHFFTFSSWMRRYWFYVKNDFRNFHQIFSFWDPLSQKKWFLRKCLSVCL